MTAEELLAMPDDGMQHELVRGELTTMAPATSQHAIVTGRIAIHLGSHVKKHGLGELFSGEPGFILSRDPDTVRAPDVAFVRKERIVIDRRYFSGPPEVAVEVISPSDLYTDVNGKIVDYLRAGTRMFIVIDAVTQFAIVNTPTLSTHLGINDVLDGGDVVPGWKLPLAEIFA